jgi:hypothetical protein
LHLQPSLAVRSFPDGEIEPCLGGTGRRREAPAGLREAIAARSPGSCSLEVSSMRLRYGAVALPLVALSALLLAGCSATNEENLGGQTSKVVPRQEGTPDIKTYAEAVKYQEEQAAKNRAASKGKAAPRSQPKAQP